LLVFATIHLPNSNFLILSIPETGRESQIEKVGDVLSCP